MVLRKTLIEALHIEDTMHREMVRCRTAGGSDGEALPLEKPPHGFASILILTLQMEVAVHCGMVRCRIAGRSDGEALWPQQET